MIGSLRGEIIQKTPDSLILEVGGVGYELFVTTADWGAATLDDVGRYFIHEQIREDAHNLYGFTSGSARQLFQQLLSVQGVGPKVALGVLSAAGEARLRQAIDSGDPDLLKGISGVGPKTAHRIIVDLRGKVDGGTTGLAPLGDSTYQALVALGYTSSQATSAVNAIPDDITGDAERVKAALKGIGK